MIHSVTLRFLLSGFAAALLAAPADADILYRFREGVLFDGKHGPIAKAQARANAALIACGKPGSITADGKFGRGTRDALVSLAQCPAVAPQLTADAEARAGALTQAYWQALVGEPEPSVDDRARTLMLTYEATDYTDMEWNFCQSRPRFNPAAGNRVCFSNDPRSYLTWGPNGATGGGGREVQLILQAVDAATPSLLDASFGSEAAAVRRMFRMRDGDPARSVETYLCGIWADSARRAAWTAGFAAVGQVPVVRATFDGHYKSASLDGGKIATFFRAYAANGLQPTEIDYAFFKDRAAHMSASLAPIRQAIANLVAAQPSAARWKVRQAIALNVRPLGTQRADRLGRDVAFYIDGAGDALGSDERSAWQARGRLRASDAGLTDARSFATFTPGPEIDIGIADPASLTAAERAACPRAVLDMQTP
jgi:hypothetical protein